MTKICIPIAEKTVDAVLHEAGVAKNAGADLVEVWLGELVDADLPLLFQNLPLPALVNCKDKREQGNFEGTDEEKLNLLLKAANLGAAYADIDYRFSPQLLRRFDQEKGSCRLILSAHFWRGTPKLPSLTREAEIMLGLGADILKFAAKPEGFQDVVTIIRLAENLTRKRIPHIVISMGQLGKITRLASPLLENEITFAVTNQNKQTAPGQITVDRLAGFFKEW